MNDIERAIQLLQTTLYNQEQFKYVVLAIEALREKSERENPKPLTLEELKERDGKPVWIVFYAKTSRFGKWQGWTIMDNRFSTLTFMETHELDFKYYGKSWLAYDHEPKGA